MAVEVAPRLAATLILVRPRGSQPEILLLKRGARARFMPNAYVFPGGALDSGDEGAAAYASCQGLDDAGACQRLMLPSNGLKFLVAAIREAFEECGLLLAYAPSGELVDLSGWDESALRNARLEISSGRLRIADFCQAHGLKLAVDRLHFFSHWITPPGSIRFDTRFFLAAAPERQVASLVGEEMSELVWRSAAQALADNAARKLLLMHPTKMHMKQIGAMRDIDALFEFAQEPRAIAPFTPDLPPASE